MGIEQEFKFTLTTEQHDKFYNVMERHFVGDKQYWNVYYDTASNNLLEKGCILRATLQESAWEDSFPFAKMVFKGRSDGFNDGFIVREEVEHYLPEPMSKVGFFRDYGAIHSKTQGGKALNKAYEQLKDLPESHRLLLPVGAMKITRTMFFHDAVFMELDEVSFDAKTKFYELEVETLAPNEALKVIHEVAELVGGQFVPSKSSKHEKLREFLENNTQKIFEWE